MRRTEEQRRLVDVFSAVCAEVGAPLPARARVLDFGCGEGEAVVAWRAAGHDAVGCDIVLERPGEGLYLIETPYRLPFAAATFDLVVSNQVLEHVQDHDLAFSEISRVLKPGSVSLHLFPARWSPKEVHLGIPFGGVLQARWWVTLWARLGIRNRFQTDLPWREVADLDVEYLRTRTNYLTRKQLAAVASRWFEEVRFIEILALKYGRRSRHLYPLARGAPLLATLYGGLRSRFLLLRARETGSDSNEALAQ